MSRLCRPSASVEYQGEILIELRVEMSGIRHHLEGVDPNTRCSGDTRRLGVGGAPSPDPCQDQSGAATANNPVLRI
jgi:hypothetical protein